MFFYMFLPFYLWLGAKFRISDNFILLMLTYGIAISAIVLRTYFYVPFFDYLTLFPVWFSGFYLGVCVRNNNVSLKRNFVFTMMIAVFFALNRFYPSATISTLCKSWLFYAMGVVMILHGTTIISKLRLLADGMDKLFLKIGESSYSIYLAHYPLLLVMSKYNIHFGLQLCFMVLWCYALMVVEKKVNSYRYNFFKLNYLRAKAT